MTSKLICAICPTLNRPELLGRAIRAFEKQTYSNRFLIIVDDAGQYDNQNGDRWQLISIPKRCMSLGEKNNICAALAPRGTWAYAKWDDDDLYMPWHLSQIMEALEDGGEFCQPRVVIDYFGKWVQTETFNRKDPEHFCYHGAWGYTRELFEQMGGYRSKYAGDDGDFQTRFRELGGHSVDFLHGAVPSYWYNRLLPDRISEKGGSESVYWNMIGDTVRWYGKVPRWRDDTAWCVKTPTELIRRQW